MESWPVPPGYVGVEHDDNVKHAVHTDGDDNIPVHRRTPVCGTATGVTSDENAHLTICGTITCWQCYAILA